MAKITLEEAQEFAVLPADSIVDLKIEEVNVRDNARPDGTTWQSLDFRFKILGIQATGDGSPVSAYDSLVTQDIYGGAGFRLTDHAENKLRQWCEAIFQMPLEKGFELDTDMLAGRRVRGVTTQYKTKVGYDRHKVDSLLPKAGESGPAVQPVAATQSSAPAQDWGFQVAAKTDEPPF